VRPNKRRELDVILVWRLDRWAGGRSFLFDRASEAAVNVSCVISVSASMLVLHRRRHAEQVDREFGRRESPGCFPKRLG